MTSCEEEYVQVVVFTCHMAVICCTVLMRTAGMIFCSVPCQSKAKWFEMGRPWWRAVCSVIFCPSQPPPCGWVYSVGIPDTDAAPPADYSEVDGTPNHRLIEDTLKNLSFLRKYSAQLHLVYSIGVGTPVQSIIQADIQIFVVFHNSNLFIHDGYGPGNSPSPLKVTHQLLDLVNIQEQMILAAVITPLYSNSYPSLFHPTVCADGIIWKLIGMFSTTAVLFPARDSSWRCVADSWVAQYFRILGLALM